MKKFSLLLFKVLWLSQSTSGLYEDQMGQLDWSIHNVGRVSNAVFFGQTAIVASEDGVLAGINSKLKGEISWRQVVPEGSGTEVASGGFSSLGLQRKKGFSLSADGCTVRLFSSTTGGIIWDKKLCDGSESDKSIELGMSVSGLFLPGDVTDDGQEDILVLRENKVSVVSNGDVSWEWQADADVVIQGISYSTSTDKKIVGYAFGTKKQKDIVIVQLDFSNVEKSKSWTVESKAPVGSKIHSVGSLSSSTSTVNAGLAWVDGSSGKLILYDLDAKAKHVVDENVSADLKSLSYSEVNIPYVHVGTSVYTVKDFKIKRIMHDIRIAASSVTESSGGVLGVSQKANDMSCGPITQLSWYVQTQDKVYTMEFPESVGQKGQRGALAELFIQPASLKSSGGSSLRALARFDDDSLVSVQFRVPTLSGTSVESSVLYVREEALARVTQVQEVELPAAVGAVNYDPVLADEISNVFTHGNSFSIYMYRLRDQVRTLRDLVLGTIKTYKDMVTSIIESKGHVLVKLYNGETQGYTESELMGFGFSRGILTLTECGKVFLLNSMTGEAIYSVYDASLVSTDPDAVSTKMFVTRNREAGASHPAEVAFISMETGAISFRNALTGAVIRKLDLKTPLIETVYLSGETVQHSDDHVEIIEEDIAPAGVVLVVDEEFKIHQVNSHDKKVSKQVLSRVHFVHFSQETGSVHGYGVSGNGVVELWSYLIPADHTILAFQKHAGGSVNNPGIKLGDGSVLVKYINPNLILFATRNAQNELIVTILDGVSGRVAKRFSHKNSGGPVKALVYDNMVIYSFLNENSKRVEISCAGFFEGAIDKRELNIWTARDEDAIGSGGAYSAFDSVVLPSVLQRTFFSDKAITALGVTSTRFGIADRRVLIGLESGSINLQMSRFLDARRPTGKLTDVEKEEGLMSYFPQLPIIPSFTVSYNLTISRIKSIYSVPTRLESTSLVFVTGLDLFFTRVVPSKGFDLLDEDFNFFLLVVLTCGLIVLTLILSNLVEKKNLSSAWK